MAYYTASREALVQRRSVCEQTISKRNVRWQKSTSEIKEGTRFKCRRKKHASKSEPNTDVLNLINKTAWRVLINPNSTVINFYRGLQCNCNVTENQTCIYIYSVFPYHHHYHHISVMELGRLLTRSGLTYPEVSSKVFHDFFCQLENSVSLHWVIN